MAGRNGHDDLGADPNLTRSFDRPAVQAHQLLHQRQADAAAVLRARSLVADAEEALEQARQLLGGNANTRVAYAQLYIRGAVGSTHRDADFADEGELQGIRKQVQDHLFPQVAIDVHLHAIRQRRAIDHETQTGHLDRRAERAGQVGGERREIDRLVRCVDTTGFNAREVQQRIGQLQQTLGVAFGDFEPLPLQRRFGVPQRFFDGSQQQREGRAQLVADVAEEHGAGAIELRQHLGPPLLGDLLDDDHADLAPAVADRQHLHRVGAAVVGDLGRALPALQRGFVVRRQHRSDLSGNTSDGVLPSTVAGDSPISARPRPSANRWRMSCPKSRTLPRGKLLTTAR